MSLEELRDSIKQELKNKGVWGKLRVRKGVPFTAVSKATYPPPPTPLTPPSPPHPPFSTFPAPRCYPLFHFQTDLRVAVHGVISGSGGSPVVPGMADLRKKPEGECFFFGVVVWQEHQCSCPVWPFVLGAWLGAPRAGHPYNLPPRTPLTHPTLQSYTHTHTPLQPFLPWR